LVLNLWAGVSVSGSLINLWHAFTDSEVWLLMVITVLVMELGRYMTEKRNADEIIAATNRWGGRHGRAASLMALPAMIGLIPMPGGALLSAPFVEKAADREGSSQEWMSGINYWFRHIWEYWWPMYPGVIVAMTIFELDLRSFVAVQFLFTPVAVLAGYFFMIRPHVRRLVDVTAAEVKRSSRVWFIMVPLGIILASLFFLPTFLKPLLPESAQSSSKMVSFLVGLLLAMVVVYFDEVRETGRVFPGVMFSSLFKWKSINVMISLGGVLVFKVMLVSSGLLPVASHELVKSGIPIVVAVAALPFLAGLVTGVALGFAGTAFPLIVGLMSVDTVSMTPLATLVLAYGFGYMGMMLSPVHLCLLVTRDYFEAPMRKIYRQIVPCVLCVLVYCIIAYLVLARLGL
jgi:integral membrane protein (TIGR00529 family)